MLNAQGTSRNQASGATRAWRVINCLFAFAGYARGEPWHPHGEAEEGLWLKPSWLKPLFFQQGGHILTEHGLGFRPFLLKLAFVCYLRLL